MSQPRLTLISFPTCPYVQRAVIALREKDVDFDVVYIDLANKPDWFLAISPLGKVPVLKVERPGEPDAIIFESAVILEYIEETAGGPRLHPADPIYRAQHRSWIEFGSTFLVDLWRFSSAKDEAELSGARKALDAKLARLQDTVSDGPYFCGSNFSYVDAAFAPAFRQIEVLEAAAHPHLLDGTPKLAAWSEALGARPSVKSAVPTDYAELYLSRLRKNDAQILKQAA